MNVHQCDHVDFLVSAAMLYGIRPATATPATVIGTGTPGSGTDRATVGDRIGRTLMGCNATNAACHYPCADADDWQGHLAVCRQYTWAPVPQDEVDPLTVVFACHSMARRASEYPGWAGSDAAAFLARLEHAALCRLPGAQPARARGQAWRRRAAQPARA